MTDTIANSTATTSSLVLNSGSASTIDSSGDQDWFRISLNAGATYTLRQDKASGSNLDSYLRLMNSSGIEIASDDDSGGNGNSLLIYTPTSSGTFYVAAGGHSSSTGAYSLSATLTPTARADVAGSTTTTSSLVLDSSSGSTIDTSGDEDWFRISLNAGATYTFRQDKVSGSNLDSYLRLMNSSGAEIASDDDSGGSGNSLLTYTPTSSGTFYVAAGGHSSSTGAYSLSATLTPTPRADVAGSTTTTSSLVLDISSDSTIDTSGDQDWFRISLNAGTTYAFRQDKTSGSNLDSYLRLMNSSGTEIASDDDSGGNGNSLLTYTPASSGTFYVAAGGHSSSTGAYSLSVTPMPTSRVDIANSTATTSSLVINSSSGSAIETSGDQDWFRISLAAGTTYAFRQDKASGSNLDSYLRLMNSSGAEIASDDDSGGNGNSLFTYTPTSSGIFYVSAGGHSSSTGAYSLSVIPTPTPTNVVDIVNSTTTTSSLVINSSAVSTIDRSGDQDWFRISLNAGTTYAFRQDKTSGSNLDPYLRLMNSSGTQVAFDDDGGGNGNSLLTYTATSSGTFYVAAGGYSSSTGAYSLSVVPTPTPTPRVDIANSTATTSSLVLNRSSDSAIDSSGDQDWFRISLNSGTTYAFRQDKTSGSNLDPYLRLMNSSGTQVAFDDDSGGYGNSLLTYTPTSSGTFYVAAGGYSSSTGAYSLSATSSSPTTTPIPTITASDIFNTQGRLGGDGSDAGILNAGKIRVMADFSKAVYSLQAWENSQINEFKSHSDDAVNEVIAQHGWSRLDLNPSLMSPANNITAAAYSSITVNNQMVGGFYTNGNAAAFVARSADALVIAFRGTNDNGRSTSPDMRDWFAMGLHYDLMRPLVSSLNSYIRDNGISNVYVTGHSLGGAMAIKFMDDHAQGSFGANYESVVFASASYDLIGSFDSRMTLIEIDGDVVPDTGVNNGRNIHFAGNETTGVSTVYHSMDYYRQMVDSVDNVGWQRILSEPGDQKVYIGGRVIPGDGGFVVDGYKSGNNNLTIHDGGNDTLNDPFWADYDVYYGGRGNDTLAGGSGSELMLGGAGDDVIRGNGSADRLFGDAGNDLLDGGSGADVLHGGDGNDILLGGSGADDMTGGGGADIFRFLARSEARDNIRDFQQGTDKLQFAISDFSQSANFVFGANPLAPDSRPTFLFNTAIGVLSYDSNGNSVFNLTSGITEIALIAGISNLTTSDFLFV